MTAFVNGEFVPPEKALVSVFDRGLVFGDGLFETVRFYAGQPFLWEEHTDRLLQGLRYLRIPIPWGPQGLKEYGKELMRRNQLPDGLCRILVTRGVGQRGYSPKGADNPTLALTAHAAPPKLAGLNVITSTLQLPTEDPLSLFKTCNKLRQVLARAEADDQEADESLLCNGQGLVVEGTSSNIFWMKAGMIHTPPILEGILPGVTRNYVLRICKKLNIPTTEKSCNLKELELADAIFLTSSGLEIASVRTLNGLIVKQDPMVGVLQEAYRA